MESVGKTKRVHEDEGNGDGMGEVGRGMGQI